MTYQDVDFEPAHQGTATDHCIAARLRDHGIDANATSRLARLNWDRGASRAKLAVLEREGNLPREQEQTQCASRTSGGRELEDKRRHYYKALTEVLSRSEAVEDRALANDLIEYFEPGIGRRKPEPER